MQHLVCLIRDGKVVSDDDDAVALLVRQPLKQRKDNLTVLGVQVAGRLIRKDDAGAGNQRSGNRHALLLAAREHGGQALVVGAV